MIPFAISHHAICNEEHQPHRTFHWRHCNVNNIFYNAAKIHFNVKDPLETMYSIRDQKLPLKHDMTGSSNNVLENCFFFSTQNIAWIMNIQKSKSQKNQTMRPQSGPQTNQATAAKQNTTPA